MPALPALLMMLSLALSAADAGVSGRAVDARRHVPIQGAEITVVGQRGSVITDKDGRFRWPLAPVLPAEIIVVLRDGHVARPVRIATIDAGRELILAIDAATTQFVTVPGIAPSIDAAPAASTTRLGARELEMRHAPTLSQAIEGIPGVGSISEGQAAVPAIRGLARGRTLILIDGSRATTERRAGANASFLDPEVVRSIDVARGPGSVAYGSDAFGGVIVAQTRGPEPAAPLRVRFGGTLGGGVPERRSDLEVSKGYATGGVLIGVRARDFGDYSAPGGVVPNSGWQDRGVRGRWDSVNRGQILSVGWQSDIGRDLGRPRSDGDVIRTTSPVDDSHRLTVSYERGLLGGFRNVRLDALAGAARQQTEQDRLGTPTRARLLERAYVSSREVQVRLTASRPVGRARLHVGADLQGRYGLHALDTTQAYSLAGAPTTESTSVSIDAARRTAAGLFAEAETRLASRVRITGGLRGDVGRSTNEAGFFGDRTQSYATLAGLAAISVLATPRLTLTGQAARGFRDPTLSDRFYRGPIGRGFIQGNPDLTPETSLQFDVTARYVAGPVRVAAAAYRYHITDLVERYAAGSTLFLFRNRGRANLGGVEIEGQVRLPGGFALAATGEFSRGRDGMDATPLDDVAPAAASATVRYHRGARVDAYVRVKGTGSHRAAGPSEVPTESYTMADAGASVRVSSHLEMRGTLRNLLNEAWQSSAGPRWVWSPGRHGSVGLVVTF